MPSERSRSQADIVIAGAGMAGLALAIALRRALGDALRVIVADPAFAREGSGGDIRASAIAAAARRMFGVLGVWDAVAPNAQPITNMVITDGRPQDVRRPTFLTFEGEIEDGAPFAHMIENGPLLHALADAARALDIELVPARVTDHRITDTAMEVALSDGRNVTARLLVAADGARSAIRERAGIDTYGWGYGQSGIVTTVAHERDHHGCAYEHFFPGGPFAMLPLTGNRMSIVWTETTADAERILAGSDAEFHAELERRFGLTLGDIAVVGPKRAYPISFAVARRFIGDRLALVGDSAHVIHPIAGQGLNMGLRDVAALAESIVDAVRLGLDAGDAQALEHYERWRRFDTTAMGVVTDGLNRLFSNDAEPLRVLRDFGLGLVDRMPRLKQAFIRQAAGLSGDVPRLLRGEAL